MVYINKFQLSVFSLLNLECFKMTCESFLINSIYYYYFTAYAAAFLCHLNPSATNGTYTCLIMRAKSLHLSTNNFTQKISINLITEFQQLNSVLQQRVIWKYL